MSDLAFKVLRTNPYGDVCYTETDSDEPDAAPPPRGEDGFWVIQEPSQACLEHYHSSDSKCKVRTYEGVSFLMSPGALNRTPVQHRVGKTAACVVRFQRFGRVYYILLIDDKRYLQNPQGGANFGETGAQTAAREMGEELGIHVEPEELTPIGEWTVNKLVHLVNARTMVRSELFLFDAEFARIAHLIPPDVQSIVKNATDAIIVPVDVYPFKLDETEYVVIVPEDCLDNIDEFIVLPKRDGTEGRYTFRGHHREILHRMSGSRRKFFTKYLNTFVLYGF